MERKFIPTLTAGNGYTYLKLQGILDEDNLLVNLLSQIQGRLLLVELSGIDRINSCGVRDWVNWLNQIQALGVQVILLKCSPPVVNQANMVANFAADAFIHSFYAPYSHPDTGEEQAVLLFTEDLRQSRPVQPPRIYSDDGQELEFEEFPESYFAFINDPRVINYQMPSDIASVVNYFVPESQSHSPVLTPKPVSPQPAAFAPARSVPVPSPQAQIRHEQPPLPQYQNSFGAPRPAPSAPQNQYSSQAMPGQVPPPQNRPPAPVAPNRAPIAPSPQRVPANVPQAPAPGYGQSIAAQQESARLQAMAEQNKAQNTPQGLQNLSNQANSSVVQKYSDPAHMSAQAPNNSPNYSDFSSSAPNNKIAAQNKMMKILIFSIVGLLLILLVLLLFIKFL